MFTGCATDNNAKIIVKYISPETKILAQNMVNTKNPEDHVYLYEEKNVLLDGPTFMFTSCATYNNSVFKINYKSNCKNLALKLIETKKNPYVYENSNVILGKLIN